MAHTREDAVHCQQADSRKDQRPGAVEEQVPGHPRALAEGGNDGDAQHHQHGAGKPGNAAPRPVPQPAFGFQGQPAGTEQRVTEHQTDPAQHRQWPQPFETAADVLALHYRNAADHCPHCRPLDESCDRRADDEPPIPQPACAAALAVFEGYAAEDQAEQQQQHGDVKRRQEDRIDHREGGEQ